MSSPDRPVCGDVYDGSSFPELHGTKCALLKGHDDGPPHGTARHDALVNGKHLRWYSAAQKAARLTEKEDSQP
jgi:hypothetical protein